MCPSGRFLDSNNDCAECGVGTYSDTNDATSCTACPEGETSAAGSTSAADCGTCNL